MENFLMKLDAFLWGAPVLILLFAVGLLYAVKTRFFQFRHFKHIMKSTAGEMFKKSTVKGDGTLTPLQAVSSALAGCVGTGNISGVATAIFVGGGTIVPWGLIPVAAICNVSPLDLARKNLVPVCLGFLCTFIAACFLL